MTTPEEHELQRLDKQASLFALMNSKALELATGRLPNARTFIDIGCGSGTAMKDLPFRKIIGIDRSPAALQIAQERLDDPRYRFVQKDIESGEFVSFLQKDITKKPLIARLSLSLHHLRDPQATLCLLKEHLPAGSILLVITPDQEMSCAYPGENFQALLEHSKNFPETLADAKHGRKLGSQLHKAGYQEIVIAPYVFTTAGVRDPAKREMLFTVFNEFRIQKWQRAVENKVPGATKNLAKTEELLCKLQKQFQDPHFFFMSTMMIGVARV